MPLIWPTLAIKGSHGWNFKGELQGMIERYWQSWGGKGTTEIMAVDHAEVRIKVYCQ